MERLTQWFGDKDCGGVAGIAAQLDGVYTPDELINVLLEALAKYEDTGLSPEVCTNYKVFEDEAISKGVTFERIVELMEAERAGRLVVLPCALGTEVYQLKNVVSPGYPDPVTKIEIFKEAFTYDHIRYWRKSCFPSSEEAEAALRKEQTE